MKKPLSEVAREKAIVSLRACSTPNGIYASGGSRGYISVWARDSMISMIGASAATSEFKKQFELSMIALARYQAKSGQIPNCVDVFERINRHDKAVTFATIDSGLWFVLGEFFYREKFGSALWKRHSKNIKAAMKWVRLQDSGEDLMPEQQPTSDWMDCFPHKYGHTINTQALYYASLNAIGKRKDAMALKRQVDAYLWPGELGHYSPWRWKDHGKYSEKEQWFDSLGNMLAIVFGLAGKRRAREILGVVDEKKIAKPYPMRAIYPPIKKGSSAWKDYYLESLAGTPNNYLNGGIWPFIGGFYVCALVEVGQKAKAREELELLAKANSLGAKRDWDFNEWIHPVTGKASGSRHQAWSAGCYLLAHEAVESGRNPLKMG